MAAPLLVVIQGAPGSGKTTLVEKLRQDIGLPIIGKDDIKEMLFDHIEQFDREFSRLQGMASFEMLYAFARTFLQNGKSVAIEGAFHTELSRENIRNILNTTGARYLEFFCHVDEATRQLRIEQRAKSGTRHPSHQDGKAGIVASNYQCIGLGACVDVDMTDQLDDERCEVILQRIKEGLAG